MEVDLFKVKFDYRDVYKIKNIEWCCSKLEHSPIVQLIYDYAKPISACRGCSDNNKLKCDDCTKHAELQEPSDKHGNYLGMTLCETSGIHDDEGIYIKNNYYPIHFCPYCGEKINVYICGIIDSTEHFDKLVTQRDELLRESKETDSRKRELELNKQIENLNKNISAFYDHLAYVTLEPNSD